MKPRIFFDANAGTHGVGYILWFDRSKADMAAIKDLRSGLLVRLYMPGELEVDATLQFDAELGCWRGIPVGDYEVVGASGKVVRTLGLMHEVTPPHARAPRTGAAQPPAFPFPPPEWSGRCRA